MVYDTSSDWLQKFIIRCVLHAQAPNAKCNEAALSLVECMAKTECMTGIHENVDPAKFSARMYECMQDEVEAYDCRAERNAYKMCKHGMLNNRNRLRGQRVY